MSALPRYFRYHLFSDSECIVNLGAQIALSEESDWKPFLPTLDPSVQGERVTMVGLLKFAGFAWRHRGEGVIGLVLTIASSRVIPIEGDPCVMADLSSSGVAKRRPEDPKAAVSWIAVSSTAPRQYPGPQALSRCVVDRNPEGG
jgi:hypothetical protein